MLQQDPPFLHGSLAHPYVSVTAEVINKNASLSYENEDLTVTFRYDKTHLLYIYNLPQFFFRIAEILPIFEKLRYQFIRILKLIFIK